MAVLTEFFVASPSEVAAMDLDEPPSRGGFEGVEEFTGIDNLMTAGLGSLLIDDDDHLLDQIVAASDDPDGPFLWQLHPEAVTSLSQAPPSSLPDLAASWSAMEEFFGATPAVERHAGRARRAPPATLNFRTACTPIGACGVVAAATA